LRLHTIEGAPGGANVIFVIDDPGGHTPGEIEALKAEVKDTAERMINYQRQMIKERQQREEVQRELDRTQGALEHLSHVIFPQFLERTMSKYNIDKLVGPLIDIRGVHEGPIVSNASEGPIYYTHNDLANLSTLVNGIATHRAELGLTAGQRAELDAALQTLQAQLTDPQANKTITTENLCSVRNILENAAGGFAANIATTWTTTWLPILTQLLN
jgi:hypothetical protein